MQEESKIAVRIAWTIYSKETEGDLSKRWAVPISLINFTCALNYTNNA